jgi:hypothetical protein
MTASNRGQFRSAPSDKCRVGTDHAHVTLETTSPRQMSAEPVSSIRRWVSAQKSDRPSFTAVDTAGVQG